ncbi:MAG TPA: type IV pilus modification protein PilV [Gammaproteobacteria bacterium]|nr:type IV pilus modification protein PilV [Gammaproteobacteria bacterium]
MNKTALQFTRTPPRRQRRQRGFTLMEVLISMVVLSIGLLGLAGLQVNSLKNNNSSYQRSQANLLANEIIDRIRANRAGLEAGYYDDLLGTTPTDPGCISTGCTVQQIAQYDAFLWSGELANRLPSGTGTVTGNGADSVFTITVMWDDERTGATGTACSGDSSVDLTCFVMSTRL